MEHKILGTIAIILAVGLVILALVIETKHQPVVKVTQDTTRSAQSYLNELNSLREQNEKIVFALGVVCTQKLLVMQPELLHAPDDTLIKRAEEYFFNRRDKRK